jgi:tetratricopeptide (TPR) repeat protein
MWRLWLWLAAWASLALSGGGTTRFALGAGGRLEARRALSRAEAAPRGQAGAAASASATATAEQGGTATLALEKLLDLAFVGLADVAPQRPGAGGGGRGRAGSPPPIAGQSLVGLIKARSGAEPTYNLYGLLGPDAAPGSLGKGDEAGAGPSPGAERVGGGGGLFSDQQPVLAKLRPGLGLGPQGTRVGEGPTTSPDAPAAFPPRVTSLVDDLAIVGVTHLAYLFDDVFHADGWHLCEADIALHERHRVIPPRGSLASLAAVGLDGPDWAALVTPWDSLRGVLLRNRHGLSLAEREIEAIFREAGGVHTARERLQTQLLAEGRGLPRQWTVWNQLGNTFRSTGEVHRAIQCFRRALALKPDDPDVLLNLAVVLQNVGFLDDAERLIRHAVLKQPMGVLHHYILGCVLADQHKPLEAVLSYRMALQLQPNFAPCMKKLRELDAWQRQLAKLAGTSPPLVTLARDARASDMASAAPGEPASGALAPELLARLHRDFPLRRGGPRLLVLAQDQLYAGSGGRHNTKGALQPLVVGGSGAASATAASRGEPDAAAQEGKPEPPAMGATAAVLQLALLLGIIAVLFRTRYWGLLPTGAYSIEDAVDAKGGKRRRAGNKKSQ